MKTASIPAVRVEPEFRDQLERVLGEGETLSQFVETAVREQVTRRIAQAEFVERGLRSLADAKRTGTYVTVDAVLETLERKLERARQSKRRASSAKR